MMYDGMMLYDGFSKIQYILLYNKMMLTYIVLRSRYNLI
jgi:hypothetical protein